MKMQDYGPLPLHASIPEAGPPIEYSGFQAVYSCRVNFTHREPDFNERLVLSFVDTTAQYEDVRLIQTKRNGNEILMQTNQLQYGGIPNAQVTDDYLEFAIVFAGTNFFLQLYKTGYVKIFLPKPTFGMHQIGKLLFALKKILDRTRTLQISSHVLAEQIQYFSSPINAKNLRTYLSIHDIDVTVEQPGQNERLYTFQLANVVVQAKLERSTLTMKGVTFTYISNAQQMQYSLQTILQEYVNIEAQVKRMVVTSYRLDDKSRDALIAKLSLLPGFARENPQPLLTIFVKYQCCMIILDNQKITLYTLNESTSREITDFLNRPSAVEMLFL